MHFWVDSFCGVLDDRMRKPAFPRGIIAGTDIIGLIQDLGNQIPDKSWMLYLLELFKQNIAIELNLICQCDNQNYFEAIFKGVNRYRFKEVLPILGHSYLRQIIMNSQKECISYLLEDRNTNQTEGFDLYLKTAGGFAFEASNLFTGIEWWNKIGDFPYLIRYQVEVSQPMYGLSDNPSDPESIIYGPYNAPCRISKDQICNILFHSIIPESNLVVYAMTLSLVTEKFKYFL